MGHFTLFILCHIQIPPWKKARVGHEQQRMKHCFKTTRSVPRTHKLGPFSLVGTEYLASRIVISKIITITKRINTDKILFIGHGGRAY